MRVPGERADVAPADGPLNGLILRWKCSNGLNRPPLSAAVSRNGTSVLAAGALRVQMRASLRETPASMSPSPREPAINAPWPALLLGVALIVAFLAQGGAAGPQVYEHFGELYGLRPFEAVQGRWSGLFTSLFVHGGWPHVLLNALGALAFGAPVARVLGLRARGAALFFAFYLICGVFAGWAYVRMHPSSSDVLVGASGAVSGLMGAASRLIERPGRLSGLLRPTVVGMAAGWLIINLIAAVTGTLPGAGGAAIAWEAHLAGYAAGLLLIGPVARLSPKPEPILEPWSR